MAHAIYLRISEGIRARLQRNDFPNPAARELMLRTFQHVLERLEFTNRALDSHARHDPQRGGHVLAPDSSASIASYPAGNYSGNIRQNQHRAVGPVQPRTAADLQAVAAHDQAYALSRGPPVQQQSPQSRYPQKSAGTVLAIVPGPVSPQAVALHPGTHASQAAFQTPFATAPGQVPIRFHRVQRAVLYNPFEALQQRQGVPGQRTGHPVKRLLSRIIRPSDVQSGLHLQQNFASPWAVPAPPAGFSQGRDGRQLPEVSRTAAVPKATSSLPPGRAPPAAPASESREEQLKRMKEEVLLKKGQGLDQGDILKLAYFAINAASGFVRSVTLTSRLNQLSQTLDRVFLISTRVNEEGAEIKTSDVDRGKRSGIAKIFKRFGRNRSRDGRSDSESSESRISSPAGSASSPVSEDALPSRLQRNLRLSTPEMIRCLCAAFARNSSAIPQSWITLAQAPMELFAASYTLRCGLMSEALDKGELLGDELMHEIREAKSLVDRNRSAVNFAGRTGAALPVNPFEGLDRELVLEVFYKAFYTLIQHDAHNGVQQSDSGSILWPLSLASETILLSMTVIFGISNSFLLSVLLGVAADDNEGRLLVTNSNADVTVSNFRPTPWYVDFICELLDAAVSLGASTNDFESDSRNRESLILKGIRQNLLQIARVYLSKSRELPVLLETALTDLRGGAIPLHKRERNLAGETDTARTLEASFVSMLRRILSPPQLAKFLQETIGGGTYELLERIYLEVESETNGDPFEAIGVKKSSFFETFRSKFRIGEKANSTTPEDSKNLTLSENRLIGDEAAIAGVVAMMETAITFLTEDAEAVVEQEFVDAVIPSQQIARDRRKGLLLGMTLPSCVNGITDKLLSTLTHIESSRNKEIVCNALKQTSSSSTIFAKECVDGQVKVNRFADKLQQAHDRPFQLTSALTANLLLNSVDVLEQFRSKLQSLRDVNVWNQDKVAAAISRASSFLDALLSAFLPSVAEQWCESVSKQLEMWVRSAADRDAAEHWPSSLEHKSQQRSNENSRGSRKSTVSEEDKASAQLKVIRERERRALTAIRRQHNSGVDGSQDEEHLEEEDNSEMDVIPAVVDCFAALSQAIESVFQAEDILKKEKGIPRFSVASTLAAKAMEVLYFRVACVEVDDVLPSSLVAQDRRRQPEEEKEAVKRKKAGKKLVARIKKAFRRRKKDIKAGTSGTALSNVMEAAMEDDKPRGWIAPASWAVPLAVCRRLNSVEGARERLDDVVVALTAALNEDSDAQEAAEEANMLFRGGFEVLSSGREVCIQAIADALSSIVVAPSLLSCNQTKLGSFYARQAGPLGALVRDHLDADDEDWMTELFRFLNYQLERLYTNLRRSVFKRTLSAIVSGVFNRITMALLESSTFCLLSSHPNDGEKLEALASGLLELFHADGAGLQRSRLEEGLHTMKLVAKALSTGPTLLRQALALSEYKKRNTHSASAIATEQTVVLGDRGEEVHMTSSMKALTLRTNDSLDDDTMLSTLGPQFLGLLIERLTF